MKTGLFQDPMLEAMGSYMTRLSVAAGRRSNIANIDTPGYRSKGCFVPRHDVGTHGDFLDAASRD